MLYHQGRVNALGSLNGVILFSTGDDGAVNCWDTSNDF